MRAVRPDGTSSGSGYAVGGRVILTAGHVVSQRAADGHAIPFQQVQVCFLAGSQQGSLEWLACELTWLRNGPGCDAALLTITDPAWSAGDDVGPVRWGRLTGSRAGVHCEVISYPRVQRDTTGRRDSGHLRGRISPAASLLAGMYEINVDDSVAGTLAGNESRWAGSSGGTVLCGPLVVGVACQDRANDAPSRLVATPVSELAGDRSFCSAVLAGTGRELLVESAELVTLFTSPHRLAELRSASFLLRADVEAVTFRGREDITEQLIDWCTGNGSAVCLLAGSGGQGKSRLARRLAGELRRNGWVGGELLGGDEVASSAETLLADTRVPLLVVIDHAETRPEVVRSLAERLSARDQQAPSRILLLARESGDWWQRLILSSPAFADAREYRLSSLDIDAGSRREAYCASVSDLAACLGRVPGYQDTDWLAIALAVVPPDDLDTDRYESALAVQLAALTALLDHATGPHGPALGIRAEDTLLAQEQGYWQQSAMRCGLGLKSHTLERAVATAVLYGADSKSEALELLARVDGLHDAGYDERESAAQWIGELYPAPPNAYWGSLQPDLMAEHLVAMVLRESPDLLDRTLPAVRPSQQRRALLVFSRCDAPYKQRWFTLIDLLRAHWERIAHSVIAVAVQAENPSPLPEALQEFIKQQPELSRGQLVELSGAITRPARWLQRVALLLSERIAEQPQDLPELAEALSGLSEDLAAAGRSSDARRAAGRAVNICNRLVEPDPASLEREPDPGLRDLQQRVFQTFADRLSEMGLAGPAIAAVRESIEISRELAAEDANFLLSHASSVGHLSRLLTGAGDNEAGLEAGSQAVDLYGRLPDGEQKAAGQARALEDMAADLLGLHRDQEAVAAAEQAVAMFRTLADVQPGRYLHDLARALQSTSVMFLRLQRYESCSDAAAENVRCRRRMSGNPQPPFWPVPNLPPGLPELASALYLLSYAQYQLGQVDSALMPARDAAEINKDISAPLTGSSSYLPSSAVSAVWLGKVLHANGESHEAAAALAEGFQLAEQLGMAELMADAAGVLRAIRAANVDVVESAWRKVAGLAPLPEALTSGDG